jgi:hypothetical protein
MTNMQRCSVNGKSRLQIGLIIFMFSILERNVKTKTHDHAEIVIVDTTAYCDSE